MVNQTEKRVLVLTDNDLLFQVIKANLQLIDIQVIQLNPSSRNKGDRALSDHPGEHTTNSDFDLIIIAISSPPPPLPMTLFNTLLTNCIGQPSLLVISDWSVGDGKERAVAHLDFTFDSDALCDSVQTLLTCE
ncbi:MAG: hypothetical protein GY832_46045 [Chloroflexi bacterium]|nr:hypothetical protein [Chloroflexota bacterium]